MLFKETETNLDQEFSKLISFPSVNLDQFTNTNATIKDLSELTTKELWQLESLINIELRSRDTTEKDT